MEHVELVVVGAGPAGIQAGLTAAESGVNVVLIDSSSQPGGQYFRQLPSSFQANDRTHHQAEAASLLSRLRSSKVRVLSSTTVWGAFAATAGDCWELALNGPSAPPSLSSRALILATGAYDRPIAFPGWTLPGVMTAGAAQTLLKSQRILPGRRVVLSGTGPLQLAVAASLVRAGAEVSAVLEGSSFGLSNARQVGALWGQWDRVREGWSYLRTLRRVPYHFGRAVIAARGNGQVEEAVIARLDSNWRPVPGSEQTVKVDTILIGYGFIPSTELSRLLGCRHEYDLRRGGYVPVRDETMQTSLPGVYVAGDGAGIGGAELSALEGQVAGLSAAAMLGHMSPARASEKIQHLQRRLSRQRKFAAMLGDFYTPGQGFFDLARDDTIICRCEEVTAGDIRAAAADGVRSTTELKALTRLGMGNCQGRICGELAARILAREAGLGEDYLASRHATGVFTPRPPIHPVALGDMALGAMEEA
jgi:NADPH-dependent 2,4-dienoyl-CoA reductase/sulfur reductase-like enzyme